MSFSDHFPVFSCYRVLMKYQTIGFNGPAEQSEIGLGLLSFLVEGIQHFHHILLVDGAIALPFEGWCAESE